MGIAVSAPGPGVLWVKVEVPFEELRKKGRVGPCPLLCRRHVFPAKRVPAMDASGRVRTGPAEHRPLACRADAPARWGAPRVSAPALPPPSGEQVGCPGPTVDAPSGAGPSEDCVHIPTRFQVLWSLGQFV